MSPMMAGLQMEGKADSGYGVLIQGFHGTTAEFPGKLAALQASIPSPIDIAVSEDNGYATCLVWERGHDFIPSERKVAYFRREFHKFFIDLPKFVASTKAQYVDRMILSGSLGSISLTLLYRPASDV
jgi:hypothetical protein